MRTFFLSILYFLSGFIFIILQAKSSFATGLVTKSLIIPLLIIILVVNLRLTHNRLHILIFTGLFFSWAGDVILEYSEKNEDLFIAGLLCFLLAHIMYLTVFFLTPGKNGIFHNRIYLLIPLFIYGVIFIWYLYDDLADMRLPVLAYSSVIISMLAGAINRIEKVNRISYCLVLTGAMLFVISDSAIAVNKFSYNFPFSETLIMSTYVIAQYLIITGYIKQFREKTE
jgi:uncharacterized membrane protein YhhN